MRTRSEHHSPRVESSSPVRGSSFLVNLFCSRLIQLFHRCQNDLLQGNLDYFELNPTCAECIDQTRMHSSRMCTARTLTRWRTPPEWRTPLDGEPPWMENPPGMENPPWMENPPGWRTPPVDRQTPVKT